MPYIPELQPDGSTKFQYVSYGSKLYLEYKETIAQKPWDNYEEKAVSDKCKFCSLPVEALNSGHSYTKCPICKQAFSCSNTKAEFAEHLLGKDCNNEFCEIHGFYNADDIHGNKCVVCQDIFACQGDVCGNGHCQGCALEKVNCHCQGPCKDPECPAKGSLFSEYGAGNPYGGGSAPQHRKEALQAFGIATENGQGHSLKSMAQAFYGLLTIKVTQPEKAEIVDKEVGKIANHFLMAILAACSGEFRYTLKSAPLGARALSVRTKAKGRDYITKDESIDSYIAFGKKWLYTRPFGVGDFWSIVDFKGGGGRSGAARAFKDVVIDRHGKKHAARVLRNWFAWQYLAEGKGGVGGPLWGWASNLAYKYVRGDMGDTEFVDSCFNLQHNNGSLFTKTHYIPTDFKAWLDKRAKAENPEWFIEQMPNSIKVLFAEKVSQPEPDGETHSSCVLISNKIAKEYLKKQDKLKDDFDLSDEDEEDEEYPDEDTMVDPENLYKIPAGEKESLPSTSAEIGPAEEILKSFTIPTISKNKNFGTTHVGGLTLNQKIVKEGSFSADV